MPHKATSAAAQYLCKRISAERMVAGSRVPAVRDLARSAGVSLVTMWKAVRLLKAHGVLRASERKGIFVADASVKIGALAEGADRHPQLWQRLASRIDNDLLNGRLGSNGASLSVKQFQTRYGVNYRTLRKALSFLADSNAIVRYGRSYRLPNVNPAAAGSTVLVFLHCDRDQLWLQYMDPNIIRAIENHCRKSGLDLTIITFNRIKGNTSFTNHTAGIPWHPANTPSVLGSLWLVLNDHEVIDECCRALLSLGGPVAVLDNSNAGRYPDFFVKNRAVKLFRTAPTDAENVARWLIHLGHRRIAYISANFGQQWSRVRFNGLSRVLCSAGPPCMLQVFTTEIPGMDSGLTPEYDYTQGALDYIRTAAAQPKGISRKRLSDHLVQTTQDALRHSYYLWGLVSSLERLFVEALKDPTLTAWVCGDDDEALAALSFLKRRNIPVPRRISVVGFNDSPEALKHNLTSYSENHEARIQAMLDFVIRPDLASGMRMSNVVTIDGFVVKRRTTAPMAES